MPRSDRKPTLCARVSASWARCSIALKGSSDIAFYRAGYLAGHRANRLTRAEREVVEAAVKWSHHCSLDNSATLHHAARLVEVERARKGGK